MWLNWPQRMSASIFSAAARSSVFDSCSWRGARLVARELDQTGHLAHLLGGAPVGVGAPRARGGRRAGGRPAGRRRSSCRPPAPPRRRPQQAPASVDSRGPAYRTGLDRRGRRVIPRVRDQSLCRAKGRTRNASERPSRRDAPGIWSLEAKGVAPTRPCTEGPRSAPTSGQSSAPRPGASIPGLRELPRLSGCPQKDGLIARVSTGLPTGPCRRRKRVEIPLARD